MLILQIHNPQSKLKNDSLARYTRKALSVEYDYVVVEAFEGAAEDNVGLVVVEEAPRLSPDNKARAHFTMLW